MVGLFSLAWTLKVPPGVLLDMDADEYAEFAAYASGRSKGENVRARRR